MNKIIISVQYSDVSELGFQRYCEEELTILPLHTEPNKIDYLTQDCTDLWQEILESLNEGVDIDPDGFYHTIFEVQLIYSQDYYGESELDYDAKVISHNRIGKFVGDNELVYDWETCSADVGEGLMLAVTTLKTSITGVNGV